MLDIAWNTGHWRKKRAGRVPRSSNAPLFARMSTRFLPTHTRACQEAEALRMILKGRAVSSIEHHSCLVHVRIRAHCIFTPKQHAPTNSPRACGAQRRVSKAGPPECTILENLISNATTRDKSVQSLTGQQRGKVHRCIGITHHNLMQAPATALFLLILASRSDATATRRTHIFTRSLPFATASVGPVIFQDLIAIICAGSLI